MVFANDTKQESKVTVLRRSVVSAKADDKCYRKFFVGNMPPTGFISSTGKAAKNIRYICQQPRKYRTPFFSTMFDLKYGIPIYAAYFVEQQQVSKFGSASRKGQKFRQEPDIPADNQGSNKMYSRTGKPSIHKGHLVPAETYSFYEGNLRSTFTYTNAVPQYGTFNSGQWAKYEKKIRDYAKNNCSTKQADLYLLTGISEVTIRQGHGNSIKTLKPRRQPKRMSKPPKVVIPSSMWTAGCCVRGTTVFGSFAVIGNNVPNKGDIKMSQVTVRKLESIIGNVDLFPGNHGCENKNNDVTI